MKIKFCGIKRLQDVTLMNEFSPDYVGFIFSKSKRQITKVTALMLSEKLLDTIKTVGVFVNEPIKFVVETAKFARLDVVQLHGDEDEGYIIALKKELEDVQIWKAVRVQSIFDIEKAEILPADMLLLDSFSKNAYGGTGEVANLAAIIDANIKKDFFLAGGLNSQNINQIVNKINPFGVDISSGIELDGFKNREKIIEIVRCLQCLKKEDTVNSVDNMFQKP